MSTLNNKDCPAVQAHISMLQGIINRMSSNCSNCKTWAITILAAMLVLIVDKNIGFSNIWICYIPVALFFLLDCYYLGLEKTFRDKQSDFLVKVSNNNFVDELFEIKDLPNFFGQLLATIKGMLSFSTTPIYGLIILFVYILGRYMHG